MKPIIISGAMDSEITHLITVLNAKLDLEIGGFQFYKGNYENYPIIVSKTNIGMSNVSAATTLAILQYKPKCIINQGTAGSHSRNVHRGDIVIGMTSVNINSFEKVDMNFETWKHTDFADHDNNEYKMLTADLKMVEIFTKNHLSNNQTHIGVIGSGDVWNKDIPFIDYLNENFGTLCEDMETAAVYNICRRFKVPVIGIRVISNNEILLEEYDKNASSEQVVIDALKAIINM